MSLPLQHGRREEEEAREKGRPVSDHCLVQTTFEDLISCNDEDPHPPIQSTASRDHPVVLTSCGTALQTTDRNTHTHTQTATWNIKTMKKRQNDRAKERREEGHYTKIEMTQREGRERQRQRERERE